MRDTVQLRTIAGGSVQHVVAVIPLPSLLHSRMPVYISLPIRAALALVHWVGLVWLYLAMDPVRLHSYFVGRFYFE